MRPIRRAVLPALIAAALAGQSLAGQIVAGQSLAGQSLAGPAIEVVDPWVRPTIPNRPGAAYARIVNSGDAADRLVAARAEGAGAAELHKAEERDGMMTMAPVEAVEIPAGGMAELAPGGLHIMLFDLAAPLKEGDTLNLTLEFERAGEIAVAAPVVRRMGAGGAMQHGAMQHGAMQHGAMQHGGMQHGGMQDGGMQDGGVSRGGSGN